MLNRNYDYGTDLSNISGEDLNLILIHNRDCFSNLVEEYEAKVRKIIDEHFPDWELNYFSYKHFNIIRKNAQRNLSIEIDFGYNIVSNNFEFKINPYSVGSFLINLNTEEKEYYKTVGKLLSNDNLCQELYDMLYAFSADAEKRSVTMWVVSREINNRKRKIEESNAQEELVKWTNTIKPSFNNAKEYKNDYVNRRYAIIRKDVNTKQANATYRGKPVRVEAPAATINVINPMYNDMCREKGFHFDVVSAHLIKFIL